MTKVPMSVSRHCYDQTINVRTYRKPFFEERQLGAVRKADLKDFAFWLVGEKGLQSKTINNAFAAGTVALRWKRKVIRHWSRFVAEEGFS